MPTETDRSGPTVRRLVLGTQLRRLRERRQVDRGRAARAIGRSESTISRLEHGKLPFRAADVSALLTCYGLAAGPERDELLEMARYANEPGWWQSYSDVLPDWFQTYVGLEASASEIRTYEIQLIPGLLQTEAYARAITSVGRMQRTPQEVHRRVESRRARQQILKRSDIFLWAVIDEGALRRPIGGRETMHRQLAHLLRVMRRSSAVRIQVLPFTTGGYSRMVGSFSYLRFDEPHMPEIVYLEHLTGAKYLEKRSEVEHYREIFYHLVSSASRPDDSAEVIARIMAEI
jgi:transcriptional regulator with XRE-family HTH domain